MGLVIVCVLRSEMAKRAIATFSYFPDASGLVRCKRSHTFKGNAYESAGRSMSCVRHQDPLMTTSYIVWHAAVGSALSHVHRHRYLLLGDKTPYVLLSSSSGSVRCKFDHLIHRRVPAVCGDRISAGLFEK